MKVCDLSTKYFVRKLTENDIDSIFELSSGNALFYRFHPPFVTKESIREDMLALPPGKGYGDKFYIGFFHGGKLAALMDFIRDYPDNGVIFIGLFMVDAAIQGQGIGTEILRECCSCWQAFGYRKVRLGVDKGNPQSGAFWRKNGFARCEESSKQADAYIRMERAMDVP